MIQLTPAERNTILAALRYWQHRLERIGHVPNHYAIIATDDGTTEALTANDIDGLCDKVNV